MLLPREGAGDRCTRPEAGRSGSFHPWSRQNSPCCLAKKPSIKMSERLHRNDLFDEVCAIHHGHRWCNRDVTPGTEKLGSTRNPAIKYLPKQQ
jgi:hypothetical protein